MTEKDFIREIKTILLWRNTRISEIVKDEEKSLDEVLDKGAEISDMSLSSIWRIVRIYELENGCIIFPKDRD